MTAQEQRQLEPWLKRLYQLALRRKRSMGLNPYELELAIYTAEDSQVSPTESITL